MKTLLWCVITTAIGILAAPHFPPHDPNSIWLGGSIGLVVGALMSFLPIFPESSQTWVERIRQLVLWRPNDEFWQATRGIVAYLIIGELYLCLLGLSMYAIFAYCNGATITEPVRFLSAQFVAISCLLLPFVAFTLAMCGIIDIVRLIYGRNTLAAWTYGEAMKERSEKIRDVAVFYNPFVLPFTLLYHGAKALGVIR